jgi:glycosyltransferase 2 family protein
MILYSIHMLKKILQSKVLRYGFSTLLIFLAFRKVNVMELLGQLKSVPLWFVIVNIVYFAGITVLGAYRWCLLLVDKPKRADVVNFTKAAYMGAFYSLIFPTAVAGDLLKWTSLKEKYPELSKTKLLSSSLLDRIIGFSTFIAVAFVAALLGIVLKFQFPQVLLWLFGGLLLGVIVFYVVVFTVDLEKYLRPVKLLGKAMEIVDLLKNENRQRIIKCLVVSFFSEIAWITPVWFISLIFHSGFSLLSVYIFVPVIALILVLPISVAGFGARENLYLIFFSQLGIADSKILVVSTFMGIMGVINALLGGIWLLF